LSPDAQTFKVSWMHNRTVKDRPSLHALITLCSINPNCDLIGVSFVSSQGVLTLSDKNRLDLTPPLDYRSLVPNLFNGVERIKCGIKRSQVHPVIGARAINRTSWFRQDRSEIRLTCPMSRMQVKLSQILVYVYSSPDSDQVSTLNSNSQHLPHVM